MGVDAEFGFTFFRVPTSSGALRRFLLMSVEADGGFQHQENVESFILYSGDHLGDLSDSEREPLMASPSSFMSCFNRVFTANSSDFFFWMPLEVTGVLSPFYSLQDSPIFGLQ